MKKFSAVRMSPLSLWTGGTWSRSRLTKHQLLNLTLQIREVLKCCKHQRAEGLVDILLVSDCVFYKVLQVRGLAGLLIDRLTSGINWRSCWDALLAILWRHSDTSGIWGKRLRDQTWSYENVFWKDENTFHLEEDTSLRAPSRLSKSRHSDI